MKLNQFAILALLVSTLVYMGCGDSAPEKSNKKKTNSDKTSQKKSDAAEKQASGSSGKVTSTLPFKDLDVTKASKGIDPGRILIDAKGKDSAGKELALSDYKGKVILLDTWASW